MMRLSQIEISGFRGVRGAPEPLKVPVPPGFLVISGRNGAGKSTVFDAFELALVGDVSKFPLLNEAGESARDYYWWRGPGDAGARYVSLIFSEDDGKTFVLTRKPEDPAGARDQAFASAVCNASVTGVDPISPLVRTSLIRDETITAFGLDLTEIERFSFVQSALNVERGARAVEIVRQAREIAKRHFTDAQSYRDRLQHEVNQRLTQIAEARASLANKEDIDKSVRRLQTLLDTDGIEVSTILERAHQVIAEWRLFAERLETVLKKMEHFSNSENTRESLLQRIDLLSGLEREVEVQRTLSYARLDKAHDNLELERRQDAMAVSLSFLLEHGEQVGLRDGHCPLCRASRTDDDFSEALTLLRREIDERSASLRRALKEFEDAENATKALDEKHSQLSAELTELRKTVSDHEIVQNEAKETLLQIGYKESNVDVTAIRKILEDLRNRIIDTQRDRIVLESSRLLDNIRTLEIEIVELRKQLEEASRKESMKFNAVGRLTETMHVIQRTNGEYVDERLAALEPLLLELYKRLQPHRDWRTIKYAVRGDVRRMLSLRVGEGALNPVFVFSSGQRRAAGLAFLLSVYAARSWCKLKTLLLDDPVQHIDDFRAVHLVEILAALRKQGHQIICAVEDKALAALLCRRLASSKEEEGMHLELDHDEWGSTVVNQQTWVRPHIYPVLEPLSA